MVVSEFAHADWPSLWDESITEASCADYLMRRALSPHILVTGDDFAGLGYLASRSESKRKVDRQANLAFLQISSMHRLSRCIATQVPQR